MMSSLYDSTCSVSHLVSWPNSAAIRWATKGAISALALALRNKALVRRARISSIDTGISFLQIHLISAEVYGSL